MQKLAHKTLRRKIGESRVGRAPIRDIGYVCDLFARFLNAELRSVLRWPVVVNVASHELMKLGPAMKRAEPGAIYAVAEASAGFGGAMILNPSFLFRWLGAQTGCDGTIEGPEEQRDFTSIDASLTTDLVKCVIDSFERAAAPEGDAEPPRSLAFSRFVKERSAIIDAEDTMDVLNIRLSVKISNEEVGRDFEFLVPLAVLDVYKAAEKKSKPDKAEDAKNETLWASTMLTAAKEAEFRLVAVLHEKRMTVGDYRDLKAGSLISLPYFRQMPIELRMDTEKGVAREASIGAGVLGVVDGQRAVRMTEPPMEEFINHLKHFSLEEETDATAIAAE